MSEVKKCPGIMSQSKHEVMDAFKGFIEDFNTATMPHEKYYDYGRWEMQEYERQKKKKSSSSSSSHSKKKEEEEDEDGGEDYVFANDEEARRLELRRAREAAEKEAFHETKRKMARDKDKQEGLRSQEILKSQLQMAYKMGNKEEVKRIEMMLAPEEDKGQAGPPHPWA